MPQAISDTEVSVEVIIQSQTGEYPTPKKYPFLGISYNNWDDYGYRTTGITTLYISKGIDIPLGLAKIMRKGQTSHWSTKGNPEWVFFDGFLIFSNGLPEDYCSIGLEYEYYENIQVKSPALISDCLNSLRDAIYNPLIWDMFEDDNCFEVSLLRTKPTVIETRDKSRKLLGVGGIIEKFSYELSLPGTINTHQIEFDFTKVGALPNRLNLVAGTNGAGKTQLMSRLAIELTGITSEDSGGKEELEKRKSSGKVKPIPSFYSVVAISFNSFDQFERPAPTPNDPLIHYTYCGIRQFDDSIYSEDELATILRDLGRNMDESQKQLMRKAARNVLGFDDYNRFFEEPLSEIVDGLIFPLVL